MLRPEAESAFARLRAEFLADFCRWKPTLATYLGWHDHDHRLEDHAVEARQDEAAAARGFRARLNAIPAGLLPHDMRLEHRQLILAAESTLLSVERVRPWATQPDVYSSGITNSAYAMVKRAFAPPEVRLECLIGRLRAMPAALEQARRNLDNPPAVFTQLAIDQIEGNRAFFEAAIPEAFQGVSNRGLQREFRAANAAVIDALASYGRWLEAELLPQSQGDFVCGTELFRARLWAEEMIDTPLDALIRMAEADLRRNQDAFVETARRLDLGKTTSEVVADVERHRPAPHDLLRATQSEVDALGQFLADRELVTIPAGSRVEVKETPPFLRATTSASLEVPGPFEQVATEAYYNVTLPEAGWSPTAVDDFMRQWYYAAITNVSAHEVWPGHHLQFLHARSLSSDVRKVFSVASNVEGWAHYAEQLVVDEGFRADDARYRLAQLQDALLRDARFVVGIRMHTQGMTLDEAERFFRTEAWQPAHVAKLEARRGTFDATYGYYTLGKLLVLELRDAYRAALGPAYSLRRFHDAFMQAGPLPLPLIREELIDRTASRGDESASPGRDVE